MDAREQVQGLFLTTVDEMKRQGGILWAAFHDQFPPAPRPRVSVRFITDKLGVCWNSRPAIMPGVNKVMGTHETILFFERGMPPRLALGVHPSKHHNFRHKMFWRQLSEDRFMQTLYATCMTPRRAARALARLDAYTRWLVNREEGIKTARENIMSTQGPWVQRIDARIGGAELAGVSLSMKFSQNGPFSAWPMHLRDALANNKKIEAIKIARELTGMGLADAKNWIERAVEILRKHGPIVVYNSRKPFGDWSYN